VYQCGVTKQRVQGCAVRSTRRGKTKHSVKARQRKGFRCAATLVYADTDNAAHRPTGNA